MQQQPVRATLSCSSCRQRKYVLTLTFVGMKLIVEARLKCDRDEPCSNCVARNVSCQYAPWPRGRVAAQQRRDNRQTDLNDRVRHLEQLLGSIVNQLPAQQQGGPSSDSPSIKSPASTYITQGGSLQGSLQSSSGSGDSTEVKPGRMMANPNETIYVSSSHWSAICNEVGTQTFGKNRINMA